jgi:hypothetical protein
MVCLKIYKACERSGYAYDTDMNLGKNMAHETADVMAIHTTVRHDKKGGRTWL